MVSVLREGLLHLAGRREEYAPFTRLVDHVQERRAPSTCWTSITTIHDVWWVRQMWQASSDAAHAKPPALRGTNRM